MAKSAALSPRKKPLQERSRQTVAAILSAAAQVLERHGYAGASTDAIALRAGVSVGSVYQYFPNKDAILVVLVERHMEEGSALLRGLLDEARDEVLDLEVLIGRFVDAMMALHCSEPKLHRVLFEEVPLPARLRRRLQRYEDEFAESVASLLTELPGLRSQSPGLAAQIVVRSIEGLIHGFVLHPPPEIEPEVFCSEVVDLVVGYLSGPEP